MSPDGDVLVLVVDATTLDGRPSGAATRFAALGAALARRGDVDVTHLVRPGTDPLPGLVCRPFAGSSTPWGRAFAGPRLDAVLRELGADAFLAGALPVPRVGAAPTLLTLHDARLLEDGAHATLARRVWTRLRLGAHLRRPARLLAVSEDTARRFGDAGCLLPGVVPTVVPNAGTPGVAAPPDVHALAAFRRRAGCNARYLLALGPLVPHKRPGWLLSVLVALRQQAETSDLLLVFAGRAEPSQALTLARRAESLGVGDAVRVVGELSAAELAAALSGADALVVASRVEGFAIPVVDAQAASIPVVAVRAGGLPQTCGDGAWLADPEDASDFAARVVEAVRPGAERDARLARGRELAARWSWDASAARLVGVLRDVTSARGARAGRRVTGDRERPGRGSSTP